MTLVVCTIMETLLKQYLRRGFIAGIPPMYRVFLVQKLQNEAADNGTALHIAYLDAKSAFDTVDTVING